MAEERINIGGMSCQHCVMRVKKAIDSLDGVINSDVDIGIARVRYDENKVKRSDIEEAIKKAGYTVLGS